MKVFQESHPWKSSMKIIHESHPWESSMTVQLRITAISIHNATLPFSEDHDCKPFWACLIIHFVFYFRAQTIWLLIKNDEMENDLPELLSGVIVAISDHETGVKGREEEICGLHVICSNSGWRNTSMLITPDACGRTWGFCDGSKSQPWDPAEFLCI